MAIARLPDWRPRLMAYVAAARARPFAPGGRARDGGPGQDCALFAAGAVQAMTGVDLARGWRGYRSLGAGLRRLRERGFDDHVALAASLLPECPPLLARPGDLVALDEGATGLALGVCQGRLAYAAGVGGVVRVDMGQAVRAFQVGE